MAVSVSASQQGLQMIDQARRRKGWTKADEVWCELALTSKATLKRFWASKPIRQDLFITICQVVGIEDWEAIADFAFQTETIAVMKNSTISSLTSIDDWLFKGLSYIDFNINSMEGSINIEFSKVLSDQKIEYDNLINFCSPILDAVIKLIVLFLNVSSDNITFSRPTIYNNPSFSRVNGDEIKASDQERTLSIDYSLLVEASKRKEWSEITGLMHFRDWQLMRTVDSNYFDFYFTPYRHNNGSSHVEPIHDDETLDCLLLLKNEIETITSRIVALVLNEKWVKLQMWQPEYEEGCVPVWGGDGFWFKAIIKEPIKLHLR